MAGEKLKWFILSQQSSTNYGHSKIDVLLIEKSFIIWQRKLESILKYLKI